MTVQPPSAQNRVAIIGGGPAGLMAAEILAGAGLDVDLYDAMPSLGRKLLMAGKGGLNITHSEDSTSFLQRYGTRAGWLAPQLGQFGPDQIRAWMHGLGIESFVGSSGRVFPAQMKAAPLLRAWLHRLRQLGVRIHVRHRWQGWQGDNLCFETPDGPLQLKAEATLLALGGGSWPQLGSDAAWLPRLAGLGIEIAPLRPANCGFDIHWSPHFIERCAGEPVKNVHARFTDAQGQIHTRSGECLISATGIEGGLVYALSAPLRDSLEAGHDTVLELDLMPARDAAWVAREAAHPRGARSLASHLQSRLGLKGVKAALLRECLGADDYRNPERLAIAIKALPLRLAAPRPLHEAISSAGGIRIEALDEGLMLHALPGVFCAGEMLDWEAPTGGYLLTACFASGRAAAHGLLAWLDKKDKARA